MIMIKTATGAAVTVFRKKGENGESELIYIVATANKKKSVRSGNPERISKTFRNRSRFRKD